MSASWHLSRVCFLMERGLLMRETLDFVMFTEIYFKEQRGQNRSARWMEKAIKEARV